MHVDDCLIRHGNSIITLFSFSNWQFFREDEGFKYSLNVFEDHEVDKFAKHTEYRYVLHLESRYPYLATAYCIPMDLPLH